MRWHPRGKIYIYDLRLWRVMRIDKNWAIFELSYYILTLINAQYYTFYESISKFYSAAGCR